MVYTRDVVAVVVVCLGRNKVAGKPAVDFDDRRAQFSKAAFNEITLMLSSSRANGVFVCVRVFREPEQNRRRLSWSARLLAQNELGPTQIGRLMLIFAHLSRYEVLAVAANLREDLERARPDAADRCGHLSSKPPAGFELGQL